MSSEELAAKYIPPEINECQEKEERGEVGKLDITDEGNGFRDCLRRAFESRTGETISIWNDLDSDDGMGDIGDIEVGSDWGKRSSITAVDCALVVDDDNDNNKKRRKKACLLGMLLSVALFGMILGVTIGTRGETDDYGEIQTSEALLMSDESLNGTDSPSSSPSVNNADSSLPPASISVVRNYHCFSFY